MSFLTFLLIYIVSRQQRGNIGLSYWRVSDVNQTVALTVKTLHQLAGLNQSQSNSQINWSCSVGRRRTLRRRRNTHGQHISCHFHSSVDHSLSFGLGEGCWVRALAEEYRRPYPMTSISVTVIVQASSVTGKGSYSIIGAYHIIICTNIGIHTL